MNLLYFPETIELFPYQLTALVEEPITATAPGRVEFQTSHWFAEFYQVDYQAIEPGTVVKVVGRRGLTLLVLPLACEMRLPQNFELLSGNKNCSRSSHWWQWLGSIFA